MKKRCVEKFHLMLGLRHDKILLFLSTVDDIITRKVYSYNMINLYAVITWKYLVKMWKNILFSQYIFHIIAWCWSVFLFFGMAAICCRMNQIQTCKLIFSFKLDFFHTHTQSLSLFIVLKIHVCLILSS